MSLLDIFGGKSRAPSSASPSQLPKSEVNPYDEPSPIPTPSANVSPAPPVEPAPYQPPSEPNPQANAGPQESTFTPSNPYDESPQNVDLTPRVVEGGPSVTDSFGGGTALAGDLIGHLMPGIRKTRTGTQGTKEGPQSDVFSYEIESGKDKKGDPKFRKASDIESKVISGAETLLNAVTPSVQTASQTLGAVAGAGLGSLSGNPAVVAAGELGGSELGLVFSNMIKDLKLVKDDKQRAGFADHLVNMFASIAGSVGPRLLKSVGYKAIDSSSEGSLINQGLKDSLPMEHMASQEGVQMTPMQKTYGTPAEPMMAGREADAVASKPATATNYYNEQQSQVVNALNDVYGHVPENVDPKKFFEFQESGYSQMVQSNRAMVNEVARKQKFDGRRILSKVEDILEKTFGDSIMSPPSGFEPPTIDLNKLSAMGKEMGDSKSSLNDFVKFYTNLRNRVSEETATHGLQTQVERQVIPPVDPVPGGNMTLAHPPVPESPGSPGYITETGADYLLNAEKPGDVSHGFTFDDLSKLVDRLQRAGAMGKDAAMKTPSEVKFAMASHEARLLESDITKEVLDNAGKHGEALRVQAGTDRYAKNIDAIRNFQKFSATNQLPLTQYILANNDEKTAKTLMGLMTEDFKQDFRAGTFQEIFQKTLNNSKPTTMLNASEFKNQFRSIKPEVRQIIFGEDLQRIENLIDIADRIEKTSPVISRKAQEGLIQKMGKDVSTLSRIDSKVIRPILDFIFKEAPSDYYSTTIAKAIEKQEFSMAVKNKLREAGASKVGSKVIQGGKFMLDATPKVVPFTKAPINNLINSRHNE